MNEQECQEAVDVDDEVEMSPRTINDELESQLNLFVKSDLKEQNNEAGPDINSNSVCAEKRQHGENSRESLPPKKRLSRKRSRSLLSSNGIKMEELEDSHINEYSDDDISVVHKTLEYEKEEDVKLNQRCQVNIYPLMWNSHSINPTLVYKEINRVMRVRLRQRELKSEQLQSEVEHLKSELAMEKEAAKEREISLMEQVNALVCHDIFKD